MEIFIDDQREGFKKHKDIILAYIEGADIEYYNPTVKMWTEINEPGFFKTTKYRVKMVTPEKK